MVIREQRWDSQEQLFLFLEKERSVPSKLPNTIKTTMKDYERWRKLYLNKVLCLNQVLYLNHQF